MLRRIFCAVACLLSMNCFDEAFGQGAPAKRPPSGTVPSGTGPITKTSATSPIPDDRNNRPGVTPIAGERAERPSPAAMKVEPLSPEVERLLTAWEKESSKIKILHGQHERIEYVHTFEVERHGRGQFYYEAPDRGRLDVTPVEIVKGMTGKRMGKDGKTPYQLESAKPERWLCTGNEVLVIDEDSKSYDVAPLPAEFKGKNVINSPLPFLFGIKVDDAVRRYQITMISEEKSRAIIRVVPRTQIDAQNYSEASIIVDKSEYLPIAVKLLDPARTTETVYKFIDVKVNPNGLQKMVSQMFKGDPFHPELKNYRMNQMERVAEDEPDGLRKATDTPRGGAPSGDGTRPKQAIADPRLKAPANLKR